LNRKVFVFGVWPETARAFASVTEEFGWAYLGRTSLRHDWIPCSQHLYHAAPYCFGDGLDAVGGAEFDGYLLHLALHCNLGQR